MSKCPYRVAIISIAHESNTFIPELTTLERFQESVLLIGESIREQYRDAHHEIGGFLQVLAEAEVEAIPILFAHARPWGMVSDETLDYLWGLALEGLEKAGPLDGILVAPHGAGVNESRHDMDGWWLTELRKKVGSLPIISTMDPHANLTPQKVAACDAIITYRENPHLDQRQRGIEAAILMVRTLRKEITPTMAAAFPPIAMNIERHLSSAEPMQSIIRELDTLRAQPGVLTASLAMGFPYADVPEMGTSFIVVTDNRPELARRQVDTLADWLIQNRARFTPEMISPEEALAQVLTSPKPVGLLDMGDNQGGGSPGDSTVLARLIEETGGFRTLFCTPDPEVVKLATEAGIGARLSLQIGGKFQMTPAAPLEVEACVVAFHDGKYSESKPRHGGRTKGDLGATVELRTDRGTTIFATAGRSALSATPQPLFNWGVIPTDYDIIILRGVHAPVGGFAEICPTLIRVNTPGITTADMDALTYHHRRKPLFPFEEI